MNMSSPFVDFLKAVRQADVNVLSCLMFDHQTWKVRPGYTSETELWDYKAKAPETGGGSAMEWAELAKDVLAFHNNKGGLIVFGVDNGFNVVRDRNNLDSKLVNDRLRKYLGDSIWVDYFRLNIQQDQKHIGVLVVPPRGPVVGRFVRDSPMDGNKSLFKKGDTALRDGDSSKVLKGVTAEAFIAQTRVPEFGRIYAIDEPLFRILEPEYTAFVHRETPCLQVEKGLQDPRTSVVQVVGVGGAGKTALATWAILNAYQRSAFKFIVSTTAKDRELTTHGIQSLKPKLTSYETLLHAILDVLGFPEEKQKKLADQELAVRSLIENSGGLLFVDNLETVDDPKIIEFLDNLPVGVRAIVTSRRDTVSFSVYPVRLSELTTSEGKEFIHSLNDRPGSGYLADLAADVCETIRSACDGLPLAIRWAVARSGSASEAVKNAIGITKPGRTGEELLEFSFRRVFDSLDKEERSLLQVLSLFTHPQPSEVLYVGSGISELKMQDTLSLLMKDALVQRYFDESRNDYTYILLPLTRTFVYEQVKNSGKLEAEIRDRLKSYFDASDVKDADQKVVIRELRQGKSESESGLIDLAKAAERRTDYKGSKELYEQALARNPKSYKAAQGLAELHRHKLHSVGDALRCYEQAAANAPFAGATRSKIYREWGMLVRESGDPDSTERAIELFSEALKHAPDDPYCIFALAQQLVRKGAYTLAIPLLEKLVDHPYERTRELSRPMLLDCYSKQGDMLKHATLKAKIASQK